MGLIDAGMEEWGHATRFDAGQDVLMYTDWVGGPWSRYSFGPSFQQGQGSVALGGQKSEVYLGGRFFCTDPSSVGSAFQGSMISFRNQNGYQCALYVVNGLLVARRGHPDINGADIGDSGGFLLQPRRAYYIEVRVVISSTAGVFQVWVDEILRIDLQGVNTQQQSVAYIDRVGWGGGNAFRWDDPYVLDTSGSVNNTRLGDIACQGLLPNAPGASTQWARGGTDSGANWSQVDDVPPNDGTDYVHTSTAGAYDLYEIENVADELSAVKGVVVAARGWKVEAGAAGIELGARYDTDGDGTADATSWGPTDPLSTTPAYHKRVLDQQPDGTPWTKGKVDALQIGVRAG